jgi:hypothetical protein
MCSSETSVNLYSTTGRMLDRSTLEIKNTKWITKRKNAVTAGLCELPKILYVFSGPSKNLKLCGLIPRAKYTDLATAACRQS